MNYYRDRRYWYKNRFIVYLLYILDVLSLFFTSLHRRRMIKDGHRVGVLVLDHLGDALLSTPLLRKIKEKNPNSEIVLIATDYNKKIFCSNPFVNKLITVHCPWFDRNRPLKGHWRKIIKVLAESRKIKNEKLDWIIDTRGDFRHNILMYLSGVPNRTSFNTGGLNFLLTWAVPFSFEKDYVFNYQVNNKLKLINSIEANEMVLPEFYFSNNYQSDFYYVNYFLVHLGGGGERGKVNRFPETQINLVLNRLCSLNGMTTIITGRMEETKGVIIPENDKIKDLRGETKDIQDLAFLVKNSMGVICSSSLTLHLSAAFSVPSLAFFSLRDSPLLWNPPGKKHYMVYKLMDCAFCECDYCETERCFLNFDKNIVEKKLKLFIESALLSIQ